MKKDNPEEKMHEANILSHIQKIQRVYSISINDKTMKMLLDEGLDSAYAILEFPESSFIKSYAEKVGGEKETKIIWNWARRLTDSIAEHVAMQLSYIARYDDNELSKNELRDLIELLCKDKRLLRSFRIHFAMKGGKE